MFQVSVKDTSEVQHSTQIPNTLKIPQLDTQKKIPEFDTQETIPQFDSQEKAFWEQVKD